MHMPIGWNGLSMPTDWCSECMPIVFINFKQDEGYTILLSVGLLT